jgi:hypothetical protein
MGKTESGKGWAAKGMKATAWRGEARQTLMQETINCINVK